MLVKDFNLKISIHAAGEGGDRERLTDMGFAPISIHAAGEGGDDNPSTIPVTAVKFQSTPPVRAATFGVGQLGG